MMRVFHDAVDTIVFEGLDPEDYIQFEGKTLEIKNHSAKVEGIHLGVNQYVHSDLLGNVLIEQRFIVKTDYFDANYTDDSVQLGSMVEGGQTHFRLWAPTATKVDLCLGEDILTMQRNKKGFYSYTRDSDETGTVYRYGVEVNGSYDIICDPYAKATVANRGGSVVVQPKFEHVSVKQKSDVILEMHVRDFSMDPDVPFINRGKFLGMLESYGEYGMNHIKDIGVGMIQIQPVNDFETVDELDPLKRYNWGYDPMQYFALEGSYSSDVGNPIQVLEDFSKVVNAYHEANIAVSLDVVFNHVYDVESSSLHKSVPYYYFRYVDGALSNGTYCGNEVASEFTMVRKLIVDACAYYVDTFGVDGFRFDLMGISDIETMQMVQDRVGENILLYGEGWDMECGLKSSERATMKNNEKLPGYAFFNDVFRDTIGGPLDGSGLGIVDLNDATLLEKLMSGSPHIFLNAQQSINYIECHDNYTMADKFALQKRTSEAMKPYFDALLKAKGIPFLQIGQSFFRNKKGVENSYKSSDEVNRIEWSYLDTYRELNDFVKQLIQERD